MHSKGIIHGDIKLENIWLNVGSGELDNELVFKLSYFAHSSAIGNENL